MPNFVIKRSRDASASFDLFQAIDNLTSSIAILAWHYNQETAEHYVIIYTAESSAAAIKELLSGQVTIEPFEP